MNILDEDISAIERERLRARKVHFRRIGIEVGRLGMKDRDDINLCCWELLAKPAGTTHSPAEDVHP